MTDIQDVAGDTVGVVSPLDRVFTATAITEDGTPRPLADGTSIRLTFRDGMLGMDGGCNMLSFPLRIEAGRLCVDRGMSTLMACEQARMDQDRWVATFLENDPEWEPAGSGLVLRGDGVVIELAEAPAPPLWDTTFLSVRVTETGIVPAPVVEGTTISLTFTEPDRLSAEAGCNTLGFGVRVTDDRLVVDDDVASTRMACSPELEAQDRWLISLLTADPSYTLTSGGLTLVRGATTVVLAPRDR